MSLTQTVTRGASWLAVAQIAQRLTTLLVTAILARQLLPEDFGLIALTLLAVNFISYFQDMGLGSALVQRETIDDDHLSTTFWLNLSCGLLLALVGVALSPLIAAAFREPRLTILLVTMMATMPINGCGWTSSAILQRRLRFKEIAIIDWVTTLVSGLLAVILALSGAGVWSLIGQNIAASVISSGGRLVAAKWLPRARFNFRKARQLASFSIGALGYAVVNHGMRNVDNAIVGAFLGVTALGYYSLAYNLVLMPGMTVCGLIGKVMFPALSSLQNDLPRFRRAYLRMVRSVAFITFPLILGLGATANPLVPAIYGPRWLPVVPIIEILILVGVFEAIAVWGIAAWALGQTRMSMQLACISLISMTAAFLIGVRWGLVGVAWAYVAISPLVFILPHIWTNHLMHLRFSLLLKALTPPFVASLLMTIIVLGLRMNEFQVSKLPWINLFAYVVIGGCVYSISLITIALMTRQDEGIGSWILGRNLSDGQTQSIHV
ncbi:MAG TPA: lipopolysaccharide biosynthesis protein [Pyrinomonadaceae bacterium]